MGAAQFQSTFPAANSECGVASTRYRMRALNSSAFATRPLDASASLREDGRRPTWKKPFKNELDLFCASLGYWCSL
eukprot:scaffold3342_cov174-Amphora_coffeaeformis.AAC.11